MDGYKHHIFLSYRRSNQDWVKWTRENLARALDSLLRIRLGNVSLYRDELVETGASWPHDVALNLARSRLMIAVLSRDYFNSDWCRLELALMRNREKTHSFRTPKNPFGLIIPLVIDDGESFPPEIRAIQGEQLHDYANPFIRLDSPKQEALAEILRKNVCPTIENALSRVPNFSSAWETIAHKQFEHMYKIRAKAQKVVPSLRLPRLK